MFITTNCLKLLSFKKNFIMAINSPSKRHTVSKPELLQIILENFLLTFDFNRQYCISKMKESNRRRNIAFILLGYRIEKSTRNDHSYFIELYFKLKRKIWINAHVIFPFQNASLFQTTIPITKASIKVIKKESSNPGFE